MWSNSPSHRFGRVSLCLRPGTLLSIVKSPTLLRQCSVLRIYDPDVRARLMWHPTQNYQDSIRIKCITWNRIRAELLAFTLLALMYIFVEIDGVMRHKRLASLCYHKNFAMPLAHDFGKPLRTKATELPIPTSSRLSSPAKWGNDRASSNAFNGLLLS